MPEPPPPLLDERGQASVEFVAIIPALLVVAALAWQLVLAGHALTSAASAARVAARAHATGGDAGRAARAALPRTLSRSARIQTDDDGTVRVRVRVPAVLTDGTLLPVTLSARFAETGA